MWYRGHVCERITAHPDTILQFWGLGDKRGCRLSRDRENQRFAAGEGELKGAVIKPGDVHTFTDHGRRTNAGQARAGGIICTWMPLTSRKSMPAATSP